MDINKELQQKLFLIEGASELPNAFIDNICKVAIQQKKDNDQKWLKNSVATALKRYKQQQELKKEKELKQKEISNKNIINNPKKVQCESNNLYNLIELLPRLESFLKYFPKIEKIAFKYIINNHGLWTLKLLSVLKDPSKIHTEWAVQFTHTLRFGFNLQKCIELEFHKNPDFMYETVINSKHYLDNIGIRKEYWKWKRKEKKTMINELKNKKVNEKYS